MKWERAAAVAEIVSSVAIVVTLVYLSVQTQQNTNALLAVSRQSALQGELDLASARLDHPEMFVDQDKLSPKDEARYIGYLIKVLRTREFEWFQYRSGILDEATWQSYLAPTRRLFAAERNRDFLESYTGDPEFKAYFRDWLEKRPAGDFQ